MRRMTALALVVALALLGAGCGGDDDDAGDDDVEATDDGSTTDDGGDDGGSPGDSLAAAIQGFGGCPAAAAAVSASIAAASNPQVAEAIDENSQYFEDLASSVPDEIKEDVELITDYAAAYQERFEDFTIADYQNPAKAAELQAAFGELEEDYSADDLQAASENLSTWFTDECPRLAGEG